MSDLARLQSQLASMDDLTSTKWGRALKKTRGSLDPANCYECNDGKLFPRACRTHTETAVKKIGKREVQKEKPGRWTCALLLLQVSSDFDSRCAPCQTEGAEGCCA